MTPLSLPAFDYRLRGTAEKPQIFDILRRRYVALTPEEWVRQHFVHYLVEHKGYPRERLANEVRLKCGEKTLRADSIFYSRDLRPLVIIEYKAPNVAITEKVFTQIATYNLLLHVDYLIVSNGIESYCCRMDYENKKCLFLKEIPNHHEL